MKLHAAIPAISVAFIPGDESSGGMQLAAANVALVLYDSDSAWGGSLVKVGNLAAQEVQLQVTGAGASLKF